MGKLTPAEEFLRTLDITDPKWDYVMHNSHWLTSEWSPSCPECRAAGAATTVRTTGLKPVSASTPASKNISPPVGDLLNLNETFDLYKSAIFETPQLKITRIPRAR